MIRRLRACWPRVLLFCLCLIVGQAHAATPPPAGMTQEQYDALVKSVGESVVQTLTEKGLVPAAPAAPRTAASGSADEEVLVAERLGVLIGDVPKVLAGFRDIGSDLARLVDHLDLAAAGGWGLWTFLGFLLLTIAAALLAEAGVGRLTAATRETLAQQFGMSGGWWRITGVMALDALAVLALWAVVTLALAVLYAKAGAQTQVASVVLRGLIAWRVYLLLFRIFLRPGQPAIRIVSVGEESARRLWRLLELTILVAVFTQRIWLQLLVTPTALHAAALTNALVISAILLYVIFRGRRDFASWFTGLIDSSTGSRGFKAALALHWHWIALAMLVVLSAVRIDNSLSPRFEITAGARLTLNILVGLVLAETLWSFIIRHNRASASAGTGSSVRLFPFLVRAVRATVWVAAAVELLRIWTVDVLVLIDEHDWHQISHGWRTAVITALAAYLAWDAVHFATEPRSGRLEPTGPEEDSGDGAQLPHSASRLETLAPFLRIILGAIIILTASLTILASLDISITPFIAGVSVVGLAISIGSQTLVHDVVSGLCYLADDAFRVGEYINCGEAKGTVAGFTLRSIRLRHHNGQIHTIPFGQLEQITNYSRDWSTLKFNLRLDRDTDLEKLHEVTKAVGVAMAEDPTLKGDIIQPLKLQGIADIADNATIMRFKITVRPARPSHLQREAIKRLMMAFKESGIEFANATVTVQAAGGAPLDATAAAAAGAGKPVDLPSPRDLKPEKAALRAAVAWEEG